MLNPIQIARVLVLGLVVLLAAPASATACLHAGAACGPGVDPCCSGLVCSDPVAGGTCVSLAAAGEMCGTAFPCLDGLVCAEPEMTCRHDPPLHDEPCSALVPCAEGLRCPEIAGFACANLPGARGDSCDESAPCGDGLLCNPGSHRCVEVARIGEECSLSTPCQSGASCAPCVADSCHAALVCFPAPGGGGLSREECRAHYSPALHEAAVDAGTAFALGAGQVGEDDGEWLEAGVVYGPDDRYGCFTRACAAVDFDATITPFVSLGAHDAYDVVGGSTLVSVETDADIAGGATARIFALVGDSAVPEAQTGSVSYMGAGAEPDEVPIPLSPGTYMCETLLETVLGNTPPVAVCRDVGVCAGADDCVANASIGNGSFDPDGEMIGLVQEPRGPFTIGEHEVTLTAIDASAAQDECLATVAVVDCTPPTITCPPSMTAECQEDGEATLDPGDARVEDCSPVTVTDPGRSAYAVGATAVTYAALDAAGNTAACSTLVTVVDSHPPAISCPAPSTAECTGSGHALVDPGDAAVTDCTPTSVSDPGPAPYPVGETTVEYVARDAAGLSSACRTTVRVRDTRPPSITCPEDIVAECESRQRTTIDPGDATASDVCSAVTLTDPGAAPYPLGRSTVRYEAEDAAGNAAWCETRVTVVDTLPPAIVCPAATTVECVAEQQAEVDPGRAVAFDCNATSVTEPGRGTYPLGDTTVTYVATDATGLSSACETMVTVQDTTPPEIVCPRPQTVECTGGEHAVVDPGDAVTFDCTPVSVTDPGSAPYPLGETTVEYVGVDGVGLSSACQSTVTVEDTRPPSISCPPDVEVECEGHDGTWVDPGAATASDHCSDVTVSGPPAAVYPAGVHTERYAATDTSGNEATCELTVSVVDTIAPAITSVTARPDVLWPPNHEMIDVGVTVAVRDTCDGEVACQVIGLTSSEPDLGPGGGHHSGDTEIVDTDTVRLRAERDGGGRGRTYTITVECTDATGGNATRAHTRVVVPHDQRHPRRS